MRGKLPQREVFEHNNEMNVFSLASHRKHLILWLTIEWYSVCILMQFFSLHFVSGF